MTKQELRVKDDKLLDSSFQENDPKAESLQGVMVSSHQACIQNKKRDRQ